MNPRRRRVQEILGVALCGALGGGANAWLCYAKLPVQVHDNPEFRWHLIPAGALHGALLAGIAVACGVGLLGRRLLVRVLAALPVAWLAGYLAWIPLHRSAFDEAWGKSLTWPFHESWSHILLAPLTWFGSVSLILYLCMSLRSVADLRTRILQASLAGVLGSLWWWISWKPWYFSLLHGGIWGVCVGVGIWVMYGSQPLAEASGARTSVDDGSA